MSPTRDSLTPTAALAVGILLLVGADLVGRFAVTFAADGASLTSFADAAVAAPVLRGAAYGVIVLVGVFATLSADRFDRPLLAVVPAVFLVALVFGVVANLELEQLGMSFSAVLGRALSGALYSAALVVATTLVVRATGATTASRGGMSRL
ncbi:hypothetical protein [Halomicrobium urmianum]|uniref:hypothetical protein n=1 Tax=Halomicrobium urmianum TaxID=1586233 RepID=UPI001CD93CF4|nr:hypothetical protein [Halomicrobium urmianum]